MGTLPVWDFGTRKAKQLMTGPGPAAAQTAAGAAAGAAAVAAAAATNAAAVAAAAAAAMGGTLRSGDALKSAVVERYVTGAGGTIRGPSAAGDGPLSQGMLLEPYCKCLAA